jgi:hypothetical protein
MLDLRKYKCNYCNETFPINNKLPISDESNGFYYPHCIRTLQEPLINKTKPKDKCLFLRLVFFLLLPIQVLLIKEFENSVLIYDLNIKLEHLFYLTFGFFLLIKIAIFICSKRHPLIIITEKLNHPREK